MDAASTLDALVRRAIERDHAAIETAVERSLLTGQYGVKVVRSAGRLVSAEPDPSVPYGTIHEYPWGCAD